MFVHFQEQVTQHPTVLRYIHPPTTTDSTGQQTKRAQLRLPALPTPPWALGTALWKETGTKRMLKALLQLQELCVEVNNSVSKGRILGFPAIPKISNLPSWEGGQRRVGFVSLPRCPRGRGGGEGLPELSGMSVLHSLS